MIGAIIGDIVGSRFEFENIKTKDFELFHKDCCFTDDTVMTCAVAEALMRSDGNLGETAVKVMHEVGRRHPYCGYGGMFFQWMFSNNPKPYYSFGNGAAMRISPVGDYVKTIAEAKMISKAVTEITHNHPEGLKGAECIAVMNVLAKKEKEKAILKEWMKRWYELPYSVDEYREMSKGHGVETCMVSIPQALTCFLEGKDFEDVIRNCISIGGDCDTTGAIAGGLAEAYFGVPEWMKKEAMNYLTDDLADIVERFEKFIGE